jgi:hypothetical protein
MKSRTRPEKRNPMQGSHWICATLLIGWMSGTFVKAHGQGGQPPSPPSDAFTDTLVLRNGEMMRGRLVSLDPGKPLQWQVPSGEAKWLATDEIVSIELSTDSKDEVPADNRQSLVLLANGDVVRGKPLEIDKTSVALDMVNKERLRITQDAIKMIQLKTAYGSFLWSGPGNPNEWQCFGPGACGVVNNRLTVTPGGHAKSQLLLGRDFRVQFDVQSRELLSFQVALGRTGEVDGYGLVVSIGHEGVQLMELTGSQSFRDIATASVPNQRMVEDARFEIRVRGGSRSIVVRMNGAEVARGTFSRDLPKDNAGLSFRSIQPWNLIIPNLEVMSWDAGAEWKSKHRVEEKGGALVTLVNDDTVTGSSISLRDESVTMGTAAGELRFPVDRVSRIVFNSDNTEAVRSHRGDVRLWTDDMQRFTMSLETIDAGHITGVSDHYGRLTLPRGSIKRIEFNIHETETTTDKAP